MGDTLGRFLDVDYDRPLHGLYTYARMCVEVDISKGLPEQIILKVGDLVWTQHLDYENTAFRCRRCMHTGHLQYTYPLARKYPKGNKKQQKKPKGWQHIEPLEEEDTKEDPP